MKKPSTIENIMKLCADYGLKHSPCGYKIGALLMTRRGAYYGCNTGKTHPRSPSPWKFVHAEFDAILKAARMEKLEGSVLYVARYRKDGSYGLAKPCRHCQYVIGRVGIRKVYFSCDSPSRYTWYDFNGVDNLG